MKKERVRWTEEHAEAAALAATSGTFALCAKLDPGFTWDAEGWRRSATAYNARVGAADRVDPEERVEVRQRTLSQAIEANQHEALVRDGDMLSRSRHLSLMMRHAGAFVSAVPSYDLAIPNEAFVGLLRYRLGMAVWDEGAVCKLCFCPADRYGDHAFSCERTADRIVRHDAAARALYSGCNDLGLGPQLERTGIVPARGSKPADVFLPRGAGEHRGRCVDVSIASCHAQSMLTGASRTLGYAASAREATKRSKHGDDCEAANFSFTPFVLENFGGLGEEALGLVRRLAGHGARQLGVDKVELMQSLAQRVSVAYQRELGQNLCARCPISSAAVARVPEFTVAAPPLLPSFAVPVPDVGVVHDVEGQGPGAVAVEEEGPEWEPRRLPPARLTRDELEGAASAGVGGGVAAAAVASPPPGGVGGPDPLPLPPGSPEAPEPPESLGGPPLPPSPECRLPDSSLSPQAGQGAGPAASSVEPSGAGGG
eukprot:Rhum_TRINITY_DN15225_c2_g3::Rhum_TRINITY_DN15225_c2_g3_i4::g.145064::m.145064